MKRPIIFILSIALITCIAGCTLKSKKDFSNAKRDTLIVGMKSGITGFHPWMATYENPSLVVNSAIYNGLVEFNKDLKAMPCLAKSWTTPDKLTWRFYLRKGIKFQNGYEFTARDVKFTLDLIMNDKEGALKDLITEVKEVRVINDYIVDIVTNAPYPVMVNKLTQIYIISEKYHQETQSRPPMGTGPYKLSKYVPGDYIELERFDGYWKGPVPIRKLFFEIIEDDELRAMALFKRRVDIAENIPVEYMEEVNDAEGLEVALVPSSRVIYLSFDFRKDDSYGFKGRTNPVSDLRVRKAFYHAINEERIISEIMGGLAEPASQFVTRNIFGYNPAIERLPFDLVAARQLMQEAGYADGFDITMDCPNNRYVNDEAICKRVVEDLKEIGVNVDLIAQPKNKFFAKTDAHQISFYLVGWQCGTADAGEIFDYNLRTVDHQADLGFYNSGFYSNPEVDRLGKLAAETVDPKDRRELMQEGFRIAAEDIAWIPLHVQKLIYAYSADVEWQPRTDELIDVEKIKFK